MFWNQNFISNNAMELTYDCDWDPLKVHHAVVHGFPARSGTVDLHAVECIVDNEEFYTNDRMFCGETYCLFQNDCRSRLYGSWRAHTQPLWVLMGRNVSYQTLICFCLFAGSLRKIPVGTHYSKISLLQKGICPGL